MHGETKIKFVTSLSIMFAFNTKVKALMSIRPHDHLQITIKNPSTLMIRARGLLQKSGTHRCNLANNIGEGGGGSTTGFRNFNLRMNHVRKMGTFRLNQSLIYIKSFPQLTQNAHILD
jgi:hypothetical protein